MTKLLRQREIIPEIQRLCQSRKYDDAISLARVIISRPISVKAELLVIEHEKNYIDSQKSDSNSDRPN